MLFKSPVLPLIRFKDDLPLFKIWPEAIPDRPYL